MSNVPVSGSLVNLQDLGIHKLINDIAAMKQDADKDIDEQTEDKPTQLINYVINKFSREINISKTQSIELLIEKTKRNIILEGFDGFIDDLIDGTRTGENKITLSISNKDKEIYYH
ncbi:hypothetical protein I4U23_031261 [Adineta vaga]|nr:hypothetical protein I4U23_031261 [Adineta vaga]